MEFNRNDYGAFNRMYAKLKKIVTTVDSSYSFSELGAFSGSHYYFDLDWDGALDVEYFIESYRNFEYMGESMCDTKVILLSSNLEVLQVVHVEDESLVSNKKLHDEIGDILWDRN